MRAIPIHSRLTPTSSVVESEAALKVQLAVYEPTGKKGGGGKVQDSQLQKKLSLTRKDYFFSRRLHHADLTEYPQPN